MQLRHALTAALLASTLAACGPSGEPAAPATPEPAAEPGAAPADANAADTAATPAGSDGAAPAAGADAAAAPAGGADAAAAGDATCTTVVEANDLMQYNTKAIDVPASCTDFTITLKHTGTMPVGAMGHNVVIAKTSDMQAVTQDGLAAPVEASHVKPGDARVVAFTPMIGGGDTTSVTLQVAKLKEGGPFSFFCTFPGHLSLMQGTIAVK